MSKIAKLKIKYLQLCCEVFTFYLFFKSELPPTCVSLFYMKIHLEKAPFRMIVLDYKIFVNGIFLWVTQMRNNFPTWMMLQKHRPVQQHINECAEKNTSIFFEIWFLECILFFPWPVSYHGALYLTIGMSALSSSPCAWHILRR